MKRVPGSSGEHLLHDLVEALAGDRAAAVGQWASRARVEQAQIVHLGDRSDRRPRVLVGVWSIDRRGEAFDHVDVRLLDHVQELARVRGERLDVAALAFA